MAVSDNILGATTLGRPVDTSGLGGGGLGQTAENTLQFDPSSLQAEVVSAGSNTAEDVPLAQSRTKAAPAVGGGSGGNQGAVQGAKGNETAAQTQARKDENAAAGAGVAGAVIGAAIDIWANAENLKSQDKVFQQELQRGFENLEFNKRMLRNNRNLAMVNQSLASIREIKKQASNVAAGGQQQLFLESPRSGRPL